MPEFLFHMSIFGGLVGEESENASVESTAGVDPAALVLALGSASRMEADAFLRNQNSLIDLQKHHLHEQFKQLKLTIWQLRMGVFLRMAAAFVGVAAAGFVIVAAWRASQAEGTVIDAFAVPPQFAQAGITGEVIADDMTARLSAIREFAESNSVVSSTNVRHNSEEDIKVEIPETGVSLGQAWSYLRLWLGHERHVTGNLRLNSEGKIALTASIDGEHVATVSGASGELDNLEQRAAEQTFFSIDPVNIVLYFRGKRRDAEALFAAEHNVQVAKGPLELANAYALRSDMMRLVRGDMPLALSYARRASDIDRRIMPGYREAMVASIMMGHDEEALAQAQSMRNLRNEDQRKTFKGRGFAQFSAEGAYVRGMILGDFANAAAQDECLSCLPISGGRAELAARAHDGAQSRAFMAGMAIKKYAFLTPVGVEGAVARARYFAEININDWDAALSSARAYARGIRGDASLNPGMTAARLNVQVAPLMAYSLMRSGNLREAHATIDATSGDCYDCIRTRASIAAASKLWAKADYWFARAADQGPSLPFAYTDWGQSFLTRGDPDAAIAKFAIANRKGPHFADALEGWGEALMAKKQSHLALAKFAEAEKYAPNWGRLHLKWGAALTYAGEKDEAKKQFALARGLDLAPAERAELVRLSRA